MLIQWEGSTLDLWLSQKEGREPTVFSICDDCYDDIVTDEICPENHLIPEGKGEPMDKYLFVSEFESDGNCQICKGEC
jgi:hypothetical protein